MHTTIHIEVNGQLHDIQHATRTGAEIKALAHASNGELFLLQGKERRRVGDDETVQLHEGENFIIVHEARQDVAIRVEVDGEPYVSHQTVRTGAEIKALAHRPPGNLLYRVLHDGERVKIGDDEPVHLEESECFITVPPVGHAS